MKVTTDHFFCIGTMHEGSGLPCQDYAHSGNVYGIIDYASISDGCSSSKDTDIGSRRLVWSLVDLLGYNLNNNGSVFPKYSLEFKKERNKITTHFVVNNAAEFQNQSCLDATLVSTFFSKDMDQIYVLLAGDGAIYVKDELGVGTLMKVDWRLNAPPYMSYHLDEERKETLIKAYKRQDYGSAPAADGYLTIYEESDGSVQQIPISIEEGLQDGGIMFGFRPEVTSMVAVFSDGLFSFGDGLKPLEAAKLFTDIKTFNGEFVKRTCLGNLRRLKKQGIAPADDFSMAAMRIEHE